MALWLWDVRTICWKILCLCKESLSINGLVIIAKYANQNLYAHILCKSCFNLLWSFVLNSETNYLEVLLNKLPNNHFQAERYVNLWNLRTEWCLHKQAFSIYMDKRKKLSNNARDFDKIFQKSIMSFRIGIFFLSAAKSQ